MKPVVLKMVDLPIQTGLGYYQRCIEKVFPDAIVTYTLRDMYDDEDLMIILPRFFFTPDPNVHPHQTLLGEIMRAKGYVIQSFVWEFNLSATILPLIGRADLFHVPSSFLRDILKPYPTALIPLPIKEIFKPRGEHKKSFRVGGVLGAHPRKNQAAWVKLAHALKPHKYKVSIVTEYKPDAMPFYNELRDAGVEFLYNLSDEELYEFYCSLDWFVSLSVAEGFGLPVREALACGVPVVAGAHTGFLDLKGTDGVYLVKCDLVRGDEYHAVNTFVNAPSVDEVVRIISEEKPSPPRAQIFRWDDWVREWDNLRARISSERATKSIFLMEKPAIFVQYNDPIGGGLNRAARLWAQRTSSETILYPNIPQGITAPIIVSYHEGLPVHYHPHMFFSWLHHLKYCTRAPIIIWMHHGYIPNSSSNAVLNQIASAFAFTHPHAAQAYQGYYLPLPIGNPPQTDTPQGDYFLIWGFYPILWEIAIRIASALNFRFKIVGAHHIAWDSHRASVALEIATKYPDKVILKHHVDDNELEKYFDEAAGFIVYDVDGNTYELSARITDVLRKEKPIIANYSKKTVLFSDMVVLFPLEGNDDMSITNFALRVRQYGIENLKPKNVPSIPDEVKIFMNFLEQVRRYARI